MKGVLPIKGGSATSGRGKRAPKELENVLNQYFGYSGFRGRQLEAIEAILSGPLPCRDVFPFFTGISMLRCMHHYDIGSIIDMLNY
jgi:hypothetical protein